MTSCRIFKTKQNKKKLFYNCVQSLDVSRNLPVDGEQNWHRYKVPEPQLRDSKGSSVYPLLQGAERCLRAAPEPLPASETRTIIRIPIF